MISRLILAALSPLTLALLVLLYSVFALRPRFARLLALLAFLFLGTYSSPLFTGPLNRSLEDRYPATTPANAPTAQAIVVLGGGLAHVNNVTGAVQLGYHSERLWMADELYKAGKAPLILVTGGNVVPTGNGNVPESDLAATILRDWGVPAAAILTEEASKDTHQNAVFSQRILASRNISTILLVTSALHMPRAAATFRRTGLTVLPEPTDRLDSSGHPSVLDLLPDSNALADSTAATKEWIGITAYKLEGWAQW
jgi:uncharacterized SAM-binding protein YcdF (DUF218 family)